MRRLFVRLAIAGFALLVVAIAGLAILISATSSPELLPPPLPTATPLPSSGPNTQAQVALASSGGAGVQGNLIYVDPAHPRATDPACIARGRWLLDVNPHDVVGYPYSSFPGLGDWALAARTIVTASSICLAAVKLTWYGHDPKRPASDRWTALLPASLAASIDGSALQRYALGHARQA